MKAFWDLVHVMILLDVVAFVVVFVVGMLAAPVIVFMDGAFWWKHRLKLGAVALLGSWFGLWMYRRKRPRAAAPSPAHEAFDSK